MTSFVCRLHTSYTSLPLTYMFLSSGGLRWARWAEPRACALAGSHRVGLTQKNVDWCYMTHTVVVLVLTLTAAAVVWMHSAMQTERLTLKDAMTDPRVADLWKRLAANRRRQIQPSSAPVGPNCPSGTKRSNGKCRKIKG